MSAYVKKLDQLLDLVYDRPHGAKSPKVFAVIRPPAPPCLRAQLQNLTR